ncbi:cupin domain-containing protein [Pseudoalteromonas sp. T1lg65]|uniref:cupin domain-containing protein n=1 Tax=Pseudoalteromonas sp. T1lg65 TaxID=2077101 RepID=UPI003F78D6B3
MDKYLVTKEEIEAYKGINKTHYLNTNARRTNKSLGDLTGITGFGVHLIEIEPGFESTELHKHYHEDECVFILEGQALATIGTETFPVRAGDFIGYRAGGKAHKLTNNSNTTLKCLVVGQRLEHDVADYPALNKRLYRNQGLSWDLVDLNDVGNPAAGVKK